jgi:membrane peptidoglycan carboxypeptidase
MGITNHLDPFLSITLGAQDVTPLQMASAYATFAADGEYHAPFVVDRVEDRDGNVIFRNQSKGERAISQQVARQVNEVLTQVVQRGTGTAARVSGWDVGGKTGSTDNNTNAWFVGFTRTIATAVWMGAPNENISMRNVNGVTVFGGTYPAQIWGSFTRKALAGTEPVDFTPPDRSGQRGSKFLALAGERFVETPLSTTPSDDDDAKPNPDGSPTVTTTPKIVVPAVPTAPTIPEVTIPDIDALIAQARERALNGNKDPG